MFHPPSLTPVLCTKGFYIVGLHVHPRVKLSFSLKRTRVLQLQAFLSRAWLTEKFFCLQGKKGFRFRRRGCQVWEHVFWKAKWRGHAGITVWTAQGKIAWLTIKISLISCKLNEEIENMYRVSIEVHKHEWKFGRTRNVVGTRAAGECFQSFFEFSQTFTSVCITRQKHGVHFFYFLEKTPRREKGKQLVNFDFQNVNSLCSRHHYVNTAG